MIHNLRIALTALLPLPLLAWLALPALAADEAAEATEKAAPHGPGAILAAVLLAVLVVVGLACFLAVLRVMFPGPTRKADLAVGRLTTGRLLLTGLLPLVGTGLLGWAAEASGVEALGIVWGVVIFLPLAVLSLVGAMAAIPHLGAGLLSRGSERSLLARTIVGSLVLGFALGTVGAALKPVAPFLLAVVLGWFLGVGLGVLFRPADTVDELDDADLGPAD